MNREKENTILVPERA